ncbi:MAG: phosphate ABC transporter substrate-binding protein [Caldilineaceae bacterium]
MLTEGCAQSRISTPRPVVVEIAGATSMRPMLEEMARAFTERHPSVLIELRGGGSALGEERVLNGRSSIAASTLFPATENAESQIEIATGRRAQTTGATPAANQRQAPRAGDANPLVWAPIGIDGIAIVVHPDNPVAAFTSRQLQDIFRGRVLDWSELNGEEGEIVLVSREEGSGVREAFEERIMGDKAVSLTAVVMPTSADVIDFVSKNRWAIGYVSTAYTTTPSAGVTPVPSVDDEPAPNAVQVASLDGVLPSDRAIRDQSYLLIEPLYLVTRGVPQGWTRQFIDFALSPAGQEIVDHYHVPVR